MPGFPRWSSGWESIRLPCGNQACVLQPSPSALQPAHCSEALPAVYPMQPNWYKIFFKSLMQPWMNCHPLYAHLTFLLYPPRKQLPGPAILTKKKKKIVFLFWTWQVLYKCWKRPCRPFGPSVTNLDLIKSCLWKKKKKLPLPEAGHELSPAGRTMGAICLPGAVGRHRLPREVRATCCPTVPLPTNGKPRRWRSRLCPQLREAQGCQIWPPCWRRR